MATKNDKYITFYVTLIQIIDGSYIFNHLLANVPTDPKLANVPSPPPLKSGGLEYCFGIEFGSRFGTERLVGNRPGVSTTTSAPDDPFHPDKIMRQIIVSAVSMFIGTGPMLITLFFFYRGVYRNVMTEEEKLKVVRLIPKRRFAQNHFAHTEKEIRPKRRFGTPQIDFFVFQLKMISLKRHILTSSPLFEKQHISP